MFKKKQSHLQNLIQVRLGNFMVSARRFNLRKIGEIRRGFEGLSFISFKLDMDFSWK